MVGETPLLMKTSPLLRSRRLLPCREPRRASPKPQAFPTGWLYCPVAPDSAARAALRPFPAEMSSARLAGQGEQQQPVGCGLSPALCKLREANILGPKMVGFSSIRVTDQGSGLS